MKFTFKTEKATGRYRSFFEDYIYIKFNGVVVGQISASDSRISFMIIKKNIAEDGNTNCKWRWITLKYKPSSIDDAKAFVNNNITLILANYTLKSTEL